MSDVSAELVPTGKVAARANHNRMRDYFALLKPRVMSLVMFTTFVGLMVAPGEISFLTAVIALFAIAIGAGASGALNMWYEADIDAIMARTKNRPIPSGRIEPNEALVFGSVLAVFSVLTLGFLVNWVAGGLLALTIFYYLFIYTFWLKRRTPLNIVIGGGAGALPPMIGWAAVTGNVSVESFILFAIIFLWTPPHFWALALYKTGDYGKVGIPMMPVVAGPDKTRQQILVYTIVMLPVTLLPMAFGFAGLLYGVVGSVLGGVFLWRAWLVYTVRSEPDAKRHANRLFFYSIFYLFALFALLLIERVFI